MRQSPKSPITLEMLGLSPATEAMAHLDETEFAYEGYQGIGHDAICFLDRFIGGNGTVVFIATELPENPGTSITNRAEVVAETIEKEFALGHVFAEPRNSTVVYIEHYPRSKRRGDYDENFSVVTFKRTNANFSYYSEPNWVPVEREQVERLIGQPFAPERDWNAD